MQRELIATYTDIMGRLSDLPLAIEQAQIELTATRLDLDRDEKAAKEIGESLAPRGNNDSERKANKLADLEKHLPYQRFAQSANANRRSVAVQSDLVDSLTRQFAAAGYQSKLHASLMAFLAASGAVTPAGDANFYPTKATNGNGQHMTVQDAADLGL